MSLTTQGLIQKNPATAVRIEVWINRHNTDAVQKTKDWLDAASIAKAMQMKIYGLKTRLIPITKVVHRKVNDSIAEGENKHGAERLKHSKMHRNF